MAERSPAEAIDRHARELGALDEEHFVEALERIPPLADDDAAVWDGDAAWEDAYRLIAAADVIGRRRWVSP